MKRLPRVILLDERFGTPRNYAGPIRRLLRLELDAVDSGVKLEHAVRLIEGTARTWLLGTLPD
jgi:hypothetical protein